MRGSAMSEGYDKIVEFTAFEELLEVAHNSGVITNQEYAEFQSAGYMED